ncbi:MAG: DUF4386 domain-containing protein [Candidatus Eisenbacteria bacterium]|nr:DUF4386 domain-containing protein [Candidatus Eisenbacteria bacterium]
MMERIVDGSRPPNARIIGLVHLSYVLMAFLGDFFIRRVVVAGDPAATATNLLAHEGTYRAGFAIGLVGNLIYIALTALFYRLFKPVNRTISLLMAFFSLIGCTTQIVAGVLQVAPLVILRDSQLMGAFKVEQVQAAALASLRIYSATFNISFVLFALFDFLLGCLILRSTFLPRVLGVLMMIAGVSAMTFLYPPLAIALKAVVLPLGALPEGALMLWLIVKGVNVARWEERAAPSVAAVSER